MIQFLVRASPVSGETLAARRHIIFKRTAFIWLFVLVMLTGCKPWHREVASSNPEAFDVLGARFVECSNAKDFACTASLFHYPPNMAAAELLKEKKAIANSFRALAEETGDIELGTRVEGATDYLAIAYGSGTIDYWTKHPEAVRRMYRSEFGRWKDGYLIFDACQFGGRIELRSVHFALPASNPDAKALLGKAGNRLLAHMAQGRSQETAGRAPTP